ncbi:hypothetical protein [Streptomyces sp. NPDC050428]|uniref:hypothetical protein n=1 Tax=Streptomyces sp. NPDC050428 TaxID=3155757 RepID=UPI00342791F4
MPVAVSSAPSVRSALFPPPSVPLHFADGDRYSWQGVGAWIRTGEGWEPTPDDGSGFLTDAEVRRSLRAAVMHWDVRQRFVPAEPGGILPGRVILALPPVREAAQYVLDHKGGGLVALRELVAGYDEDCAYDIPGVSSGTVMTDVVTTIVADHSRPWVTYDESTGRVYARYERPVDLTGSWGVVECLHVFVLSESPSGV